MQEITRAKTREPGQHTRLPDGVGACAAGDEAMWLFIVTGIGAAIDICIGGGIGLGIGGGAGAGAGIGACTAVAVAVAVAVVVAVASPGAVCA